jgi:hypothetical protein
VDDSSGFQIDREVVHLAQLLAFVIFDFHADEITEFLGATQVLSAHGAVLSDLRPARPGIGSYLRQSREGHERRGGGAGNDLKFPFHISSSVFCFPFEASLLFHSTCTIGEKVCARYGVLSHPGFFESKCALAAFRQLLSAGVDLPRASFPLVVTRISQSIQAFGFHLLPPARLESAGSAPRNFGFGKEKAPDSFPRPLDRGFNVHAGAEQSLEKSDHHFYS